jgi:glycosyltransferase involved in cell wall biosynthesis
MELFTIMRFIDDRALGKNPVAFRDRYVVTDRFGGITGYRRVEEVTRKIASHTLRRTKDQALDDLPGLMRALSLVVQLPRYEGYGMAPLEGMASGVPFVATDQGYYRSFSGQGTCGVIVAGEDTAEASREIVSILTDRDRYGAMARAARSAAETHFSIQAEADAIAGVYEALWAEG